MMMRTLMRITPTRVNHNRVMPLIALTKQSTLQRICSTDATLQLQMLRSTLSVGDMIHLYEELVDSLSDFEDEGYIIDPKQVYLCRRNDPHLQSLLDEQ